jgi:hypothetical protein
MTIEHFSFDLTRQTLCSKHYSKIFIKPICKTAVNIAVKYSQTIAQADTGTVIF